jgi:hypothetical protein
MSFALMFHSVSYRDNGDGKSGLTDVTVELIDRLVIFGSVDDVRRIQVHWPGSFSAGCSASLWEIRMASSDFTSVGSHASKDFARLFVPEVKRNNIGWAVRSHTKCPKMKHVHSLI